MNLVTQLIGEGKDLTVLQMSIRGIIVFIIALLLIRISGRRSFGQHTAIDNIVAILLGAILSRAVTGASPFIPVVVCSLVIVLAHRLLGSIIAKNENISDIVEGDKILVFKNGAFIEENLEKAQVSKENIIQGIRESALTDSLDEIERVYMEKNGVISVVKK